LYGGILVLSWGIEMLPIAGSLVLYLIDPFGAMIFILLTGFTMYDVDEQALVILAIIMLGIVRRYFDLGKAR